MLSPAEYYERQTNIYTDLLTKATLNTNRIATLRLWTAVGTIVAIVWVFQNNQNRNWWIPVVLAAAFLLLVRIHTQFSAKKKLLLLHLSVYGQELQALKGNYTSFRDGTGYTDIGHPYSYDLDIFGKGSVYQVLCRTVTEGGAAQLAGKLSALTLVKETITERQEIIRELSSLPEFLQKFRVAGLSVDEGPKDQERLTQWLQGADLFYNNIVARVAAILMPALSTVFIIWSVVTGSVVAGLGLTVVANWILLAVFQKKIKQAVQEIGSSAALIDKYESLLQQIGTGDFTHAWLQKLRDDAKKSGDSLTRFRKLVHLFDSRSNGMTGPLMNTLFLFDFYCLLRLESWRKNNKSLLIHAIDATIETDVYVSCAVYAFNHPGQVYPEITSAGTEIFARDLRHPLLHPQTAIGNDLSIGTKERFYLLTGANMTGKSTFIRAIGVSNVVGNLGLPLPAKELSFPLLQLYTSMRITDSVQEDISYFRAELNRIKSIMDHVKHTKQTCLVLLDEPLRGTNSTDKQQGTRAIIETLLNCNARGIVATHDTGLCDMASTFPGLVSNYHFESKVQDSGLSFDFKLKKGGSISNNATILMRQMGIIK
jgi:hypothetical protein